VLSCRRATLQERVVVSMPRIIMFKLLQYYSAK
jgi:hypothetical protein